MRVVYTLMQGPWPMRRLFYVFDLEKLPKEPKRVVSEWPGSHNNHRLCHPQKAIPFTYMYWNDLICMSKFLLKGKHQEAKYQ